VSEFIAFPKVPRVTKNTITITEKIDGTNAAIQVTDEGIITQSRNRIITPDHDNYGFSRWAHEHENALVEFLGPGVHFGEWWGLGIQRGYGMTRKTFSLFNTHRWSDTDAFPDGVAVVPVLRECEYSLDDVGMAQVLLKMGGSKAAPGYNNPEGVMVFFHAFGKYLKAPFDPNPKGIAA
jgi:hypothetical protein